MTNDELKKKIVEILCKVWIEPVPCTAERKFEHAADALIAAGIGDVKEAEAEANRYEMLYKLQNQDMALAERRAHDAEHRAEVAERALRSSISFLTCRVCQAFLYGSCDTDACGDERCINNFLKQAKKELAEERKE